MSYPNIRVGNCIYNGRYIKSSECNDKECQFVVANTTSYHNRDEIVKCEKDSLCYNKLSNWIKNN